MVSERQYVSRYPWPMDVLCSRGWAMRVTMGCGGGARSCVGQSRGPLPRCFSPDPALAALAALASPSLWQWSTPSAPQGAVQGGLGTALGWGHRGLPYAVSLGPGLDMLTGQQHEAGSDEPGSQQECFLMLPATVQKRPQVSCLLCVAHKGLKSHGTLLSLVCPYMGRDLLVEMRKDGFLLLL